MVSIAVVIIYMLVVLGIGIYVRRTGIAETGEGYLLGERRIGPCVTAFTHQSTSMSGYMFLGAGSMAYTTGIYSLWFGAGDVWGGPLDLSIVGRRLRRFTKLTGALTSIEFLEKRYPMPAVRWFGAIVCVLCMWLYVTAQAVAAGKGLGIVTGLPYTACVVIGLAVIVTYTFLGGYYAVAWTDFLQGCVMLIGIQAILWTAFAAVGGASGLVSGMTAKDPGLVGIWGPGNMYKGMWGLVIGAVLLWSIGYMGWPHVIVRNMAIDKASDLRPAVMWSWAYNCLFVISPYIVALCTIILIPGLVDPEMAIFETAHLLLPAVMFGIVMAAVMAAIMSTADSLLLQGASSFARDIYHRFINPKATEKRLVYVTRLAVAGMAIVTLILAITRPPAVFAAVVFVSDVLMAAFLPVVVAGLYWKRMNKYGALSSMVVGTIVAMVWTLADLAPVTGMSSGLMGIICSAVVLIVVSLVTPPPSREVVEALELATSLEPLPGEIEKKSEKTLAPEAKCVTAFINERVLEGAFAV